jgi:small GTP-binding protein
MNWIEYRIKQVEEGATELDLSVPGSGSKDLLTEFPPAILNLKHLTKLDLGWQAIREIPSEFKWLESLRELSLWGCRNLSDKTLALPPGLTSLNLFYAGTGTQSPGGVDFKSLPNLESLDVRDSPFDRKLEQVVSLTRLRELAFGSDPQTPLPANLLAKLGDLRSLSIWGPVPPSLLAPLSELEKLSIWHGREDILDEIGMLPKLRALTYRGQPLQRIPRAWFRLGLEELEIDFERRGISNEDENRGAIPVDGIAELGALKSLRTLGLQRVVAPIGAIVAQLGNLESLSYRYAPLRHFPSECLALSRLQNLELINTGLSEVPAEISRLAGLEHLNLSSNNISSLPNTLSGLHNLKTVWIFYSDIEKLPASFAELSKLETISLGGSKLRHWPQQLFELPHLERLVLSECGLTTIPPEIARLTKLQVLSLDGNAIDVIPPVIGQLPRLKQLDISNNPITDPPPEVIAGGTAAIQEYFSDLAAAPSSRLFEAKLVIVGEGDVGKTCLTRKLVDPVFDLQAHSAEILTTKGIDIKEWHTATEVSKDFKINVWDFGGQEIYHHTHQFFLTKRSLYIFVWDARREDRVEGFDYWLNVVRLLSENSPILIVLNKADIRIKEIDQKGLTEKFANIVGFHKVSALTGAGIPGLDTDIKSNVSHLPHVGIEWPGQWSQVRATLERDPRNYVDYETYLQICSEAGLSKQKADVLSFTLHHLGVILHFQEDPILQKIVILKPEWGTNAVYAVLDTTDIQLRNGRFSFSDLAGIWGETIYPPSKHAELLQLMIRFELCFQLEGSREYIVPELLSATRPQFAWNSADALRFEYQYDFMPAGIITRFIARNHTLIEGTRYWRFGVLLAWEDTRALVISEPLFRKIRIEISGRDKKGLLSVVRRDFAQIHKTLNYPEAHQMIPCICSKCKAGEPFLYDYDRVRNYFENNIAEIVCDRSFEKLSTELLLTGVFSRAEIAAVKTKLEQPIHIEHYYAAGGEVMSNPRKPPRESEIRSPWASGSFYLFAAVLMLALIGAAAKLLNWWMVPVVVIGGLIAVTVIGALQLKQDARLSDSSFLKLMALTFRQLPLLKQVGSSPSKEGSAPPNQS